MKGERRFRACVLATALFGQAAYAMAAEKPFFLVLGAVAGWFSWRLVSAQMADTAKPLWRPLLNGLVLAAIAHLIFQLLRPDRQEPITSLTDFLSFVMLVKLLDRARMRDEAQLMGLSLFVVIGALLTGQSLALGIALALYTPMAILCAVLLQVFVGRERIGNRLADAGIAGGRAELDAAITRTRGWRSLLGTGVACVVLSMGAGVVGFLLTPRQLAQLGGAMGPLNKSATTAFTDTITLGNGGFINQNQEAVMDVAVRREAGESPSGSPGTIYLRGAALTRYIATTGRWTAEAPMLDDPDREKNNSSRGRLTIAPPNGLTRVYHYDIVRRNTKAERTQLFAPLQPLSVSVEGMPPFDYTQSSALLMVSSPGGRLAYSVTSSPDYRSSESQPLPDTPLNTFSAPIRTLGAQLLGRARIDRASLAMDPASVRHAAQAMMTHLGTFHYTLEMVAPPPGTDPLEHFLFDRKAGNCEYFAAAMTALLQSVGVRARVVTGYVAAEFNPVSGRYTVRQSDAHAWVEVRTSDDHWETFDPTPAGELQSSRRRHSGPLAWAQNLWDAVEFSWLDNVVAYDRGIRLDLSGPRTGDAAYRWQQKMLRWTDRAKSIMPKDLLARSVVVGVVVFGLVMAVFGFVRLGGGAVRAIGAALARLIGLRRVRGGSGVLITEQTRFYRHALDALHEGGVAKPATETPLRHALAGVAPRSPEAAGAFERVTHLYYAARFGGQAPSEADRQGAEADIRLLRQALVTAATP
jgi:transglutaminase-like putative cysteine protease